MKDWGSLSSGFFSCDANLLWAALYHPQRTWWGASAKHINMKFMLLALVEVIKSFVSAPAVSCLPVSMEVCLANSLGSLRTFPILNHLPHNFLTSSPATVSLDTLPGYAGLPAVPGTCHTHSSLGPLHMPCC